MGDVRRTLHRGRRIVEIDFDGCVPGTFAPIISEAQRLLAGEPPGSVLALARFENVEFDGGTVAEVQRFARVAMPFLRANALVGVAGVKRLVFDAIRPFFKVPVELFETVADARDWLSRR